ncbi:hypothetical protein BDV29DRAFT_186162 [Aspergillus leporis]|uniref:Extracellular membrane protein CFEM domain-containing protein n=1 Tax=Aspergillus leporis TaxID=41062 RepID=A0A5N5WIK9_9EURO|nr:hypothetical protein BDV29DRAFT_186162 [Aspergillus leporis]
MTILKTLLLATILSLAATATETNCPAGWLPNTFHGTKCCSGNMVIDEQGAYCCVNDMRPYKEALTNTAKRYTTAMITAETNWSTVDNSCIAKVRFTASDYSAQVSSASRKAEATPTNASTSEITSMSTIDSGASSVTSTQTSTPTSNGAMPRATAEEVVLGGAAFAASLFML